MGGVQKEKPEGKIGREVGRPGGYVATNSRKKTPTRRRRLRSLQKRALKQKEGGPKNEGSVKVSLRGVRGPVSEPGCQTRITCEENHRVKIRRGATARTYFRGGLIRDCEKREGGRCVGRGAVLDCAWGRGVYKFGGGREKRGKDSPGRF